jgi:hypothetical protein
MVIVDGCGHPMKYDALTIMEEVVATQACRIELDIPTEDGRGWRRTDSWADTQDDGHALDEAWRHDMSTGAAHLLEETWVPANDPHYDAKVFPHMHPYGTGSLLAEFGSGGVQRHARNRLTMIQAWFRRSALWGFWSLGRLHQNELFFKNLRRRQAGRRGASAADDPDPVVRLFGTAQPGAIPESSEWWKRQQRDLFAISDDAELGMMQTMITVTANDSSPEMLAAIRRGPFATPTEEEMFEYLLTRKRRDQERPPFENFSLEHVLAFQRRVWAIKERFMRRGSVTPLGRIRDWWDRTEAQGRAALHSHILCWFQPRKRRGEYAELDAVPRRKEAGEPRQRPRSQHVEPLRGDDNRLDNIYQRFHVGKIVTEMVRPIVAAKEGQEPWGGYDVHELRIAGLARAIQTRLYLHSCSVKYCLQNRSACRFFFPWPLQPYQVYDHNTERVAGQRRLEEDDQWLNPHELYLAMFSPSTTHVLPFDPHEGADTARQYAGKYASKPEKHYFLETEKEGGVRDFLKCRTVGLCMTHNRLLNFHVVRSTRPVQFVPTEFIPPRECRTPRDPTHVERNPDYPDPHFYLSYTGKYFFRSDALRHLRVEQFNRYFVFTTEHSDANSAPTGEDTIEDQEEDPGAARMKDHKHFDEIAYGSASGEKFLPSVKGGVGGARRRRGQFRLGVSRTAFLEPIGTNREKFYEQRLLLGLSWHCPAAPIVMKDGSVQWHFVWVPPPPEEFHNSGAGLEPHQLLLGGEAHISFEQKCAEIEEQLCSQQHDLVCACCCAEDCDRICDPCRFATGFHCCENAPGLRWRKGTLFAAQLDVQRVIFNLHRKNLKLTTLQEKLDEYVAAGLVSLEMASSILRLIEQERGGAARTINDAPAGADDAGGTGEGSGPELQERLSSRLSAVELAAELERRENCLSSGGMEHGLTDQWRVYQHITRAIGKGGGHRRLRLMVQASAGTGKSFLLTTVFLWCLVNGRKTKACAPTGIAAANVEIEGTDVAATTLHATFALDAELDCTLDFGKPGHEKVSALLSLEVLLLDEVSMMDTDCWDAIRGALSAADDCRRPDVSTGQAQDAFGDIHVILFGDFKQLPPATSKAPFIAEPSAVRDFDFRVLRQNRRVVSGDTSRTEELESFHQVLADIGWGKPTERVRAFITKAYVQGAECGSAQRAELEGSTSVFTKRRFRDRWNRAIVRRLAKTKSHSLKIKARVRARGARGQNWFSDRRAELTRKRSRPQSLWNLHVAGDWHSSLETVPTATRPHMMRCMLVQNLALDQRFANGTQGRLMCWDPSVAEAGKAVPASHPELLARFVKESSLAKQDLSPMGPGGDGGANRSQHQVM